MFDVYIPKVNVFKKVLRRMRHYTHQYCICIEDDRVYMVGREEESELKFILANSEVRGDVNRSPILQIGKTVQSLKAATRFDALRIQVEQKQIKFTLGRRLHETTIVLPISVEHKEDGPLLDNESAPPPDDDAIRTSPILVSVQILATHELVSFCDTFSKSELHIELKKDTITIRASANEFSGVYLGKTQNEMWTSESDSVHVYMPSRDFGNLICDFKNGVCVFGHGFVSVTANGHTAVMQCDTATCPKPPV